MCCHPNGISLFSAAAAFVPSGWEAIKLFGPAGSPARHNTCGTNAEQNKKKKKKRSLATTQISASTVCSCRSLCEQRDASLRSKFPLIWEHCSRGSCGKAALLCPSLSSPSNLHYHHLLLRVPALRPPCQRDTNRGGWSCRMVCGAQRAPALPRRKSPSVDELARDWSAPPGVSSQSESQHVVLPKRNK